MKYVGKIFHDLRRSGVRNMIRAGVPQSVAMHISGHKTISVFLRYNITDEKDVLAAGEKLARYHAEERVRVKVGSDSGQIATVSPEAEQLPN